ncbi:MAG: PhnD/SsuA/transferrin family substrate-binding protein [Pseudomonadota bacterium]
MPPLPLLALLAGCTPRPASDQLTPIRIGASSLTPLHAALGEILERTDILAQHGFEGSFLDFERGKDQHERCAAGEVDATFSCEAAAMVHLHHLPGSVISGSPGALGRMALVVRQDSPVQGIADLKGSHIAYLGGASADLALDGWLREAGIAETVRVDMAQGHGERDVLELEAGRLDGLLLWDPWLAKALDEHPFRVVASTPFWSVVLDFDANLPDEAWHRYDAALVDALAWGREHPDQAAAWAAERGRFSPALAREVLDFNDYLAGRAEPTLQVTPVHQERLEACAVWAAKTHMVPMDFTLAPRQKAVR